MLTIDNDEVLWAALQITDANLKTAAQIIQRQNETIEQFKAAQRRGANIAGALVVLPIVVRMLQLMFAPAKSPAPAPPASPPRTDANTTATKRDLHEALVAAFTKTDVKPKANAAQQRI